MTKVSGDMQVTPGRRGYPNEHIHIFGGEGPVLALPLPSPKEWLTCQQGYGSIVSFVALSLLKGKTQGGKEKLNDD